MPQQLSAAQLHRVIQVAQNDAPATSTHEAVGQPAEPSENPLAEHLPGYYSGVALAAAVLILGLAAFCKSKGLRTRNPSRRQSLLEQSVESITWFSKNSIGPGGEKYAPLIGTIFCFILFSNLMGVLPTVWSHKGDNWSSLTPAPTSNLSVTLAIALIVFIYVQYVGIKANGVGGYIKHFAGPVWYLAPLMFPLEIVGAIAKPVSLSIRLFGNIFGEETVTAALIGLALAALPIWAPIPFQLPMLMFGVFGSIVQAGVFTILTCAYIALAIGDHDSHNNHHEEDEFGADTIGGVHAAH